MNRFLAYLLIVSTSCIAFDRTARAQDARTPRVYDLLPLLHTNSVVANHVSARGPLVFERRERSGLSWAGEGGPFDVRNQAMSTPEEGSWTIDVDALTNVLASCLSSLFERDADDFELMTIGGTLRGQLTGAEHQAALYVLDRLRDATAALVEVECVLVTPEAWSEMTKTTKFAGDQRNAIFERSLLDPRSRFLSAVGRNGQWTSSGPLTRHRVHDDFEVKQTGVIPVLRPMINDRWAGERLEVVPLLLRRQGKVFLDLAIGKYAVRPQKMILEGPWGELDAPVQEEQLLSTSLVVQPGQAVLAGELNTPPGLIALVRVNSSSHSPRARPPRAGERMLRVYETAPLFRIYRRSLEDAGLRVRWTDADLANRLGSQLGEDGDSRLFAVERLGDDLAVVASGEVHQWIGSMIDEERAKLARNARIELEVLTVPRAVYAELRRHRDGVTLLDDGWSVVLENQAGVRRERYSVAGAAGQIHGFRNVGWESLLMSVEQVSGGTGFAIIEVADPILGDGGSGTQLRLEATLSDDGTHAHLRFEGERARLLEKRAVSTRYPVITAVTEQTSESAPAVIGQEVKLTLPTQESVRWGVLRSMPLGRWGVLYRDAKAGEGVQLVVARVTREDG